MTPRAKSRRWRITLLVGSCLLAMGAAQPPAAAATAALRLSPQTGPPTSLPTVKGRGFGPSEAVDLKFDTQLVAQTVTDQAGAFSTKITVPSAAPPGTHQVEGTGESSGLSASAVFTVRTDWPKFHFDLANSGSNPYENVLSPSTVSGLTQGWAAQVAPPGGFVSGSMAVVKGIVYVGASASPHAYVDAFRASTGRFVWQQRLSFALSTSSVTLASDVLYVGGLTDHTLHAFDATPGIPSGRSRLVLRSTPPPWPMASCTPNRGTGTSMRSTPRREQRSGRFLT